MRLILYTTVCFIGFIALETVFIALATGYLFVQFKFPSLANAGFFLSLAGEDLAAMVRYLLFEQPHLVIQSKHRQTGTVVWSLHYFSLSLIVHLGLAYLLGKMCIRYGPGFKYQARPLLGSLLLLVSSLYLFLGSCCSGGPNWIVQTWLLALVFNPITSSNATIQLYQSIKGSFLILQIMLGGAGVYLLYRYKTGVVR